MAVNLGSNLFNAFTERLDSSQTANMVKQQQLRKQAKEDALDEYDRERILSVNPQGVRDVDRPGFDQRMQKIQLYYNTNKDKIRKGGTPEAYEYEKLYRDTGSYINQSKERTAKQDAAMKFYQEKLKQDGRVPEDFIKELGTNDKAIDDIVTFDKVTGEPIRSSTFDLKKWLSNPKPYNQQSGLKAYADIKRTPKVSTKAISGEPLKMEEITEETFDDGAKQVISMRASNDFENSHSFSSAVLEEIKDPIARAKLETTFKEQYGTTPQSNHDYATAFRLQELQPKVVKSKVVDNKDALMTRRETFAKDQQARAQANREKNIRLSAALGVGSYKSKLEFAKTVEQEGLDLSQVDVDNLFNEAIQKDRTLNLDPTFLGDDADAKYAENLRLTDDGKNVEYEIKYKDETIKKTRPVSLIKQKMIKDLGIKKPGTPNRAAPNQQPVRTPKDIKSTKMTTNKKPSWAN